MEHGLRSVGKEPLTILGPKRTKRERVRMAKQVGDHISEPTLSWTAANWATEREVRLSDVAELSARRTPHTDPGREINEIPPLDRVPAGGVRGRSFCYRASGFSEDQPHAVRSSCGQICVMSAAVDIWGVLGWPLPAASPIFGSWWSVLHLA